MSLTEAVLRNRRDLYLRFMEVSRRAGYRVECYSHDSDELEDFEYDCLVYCYNPPSAEHDASVSFRLDFARHCWHLTADDGYYILGCRRDLDADDATFAATLTAVLHALMNPEVTPCAT